MTLYDLIRAAKTVTIRDELDARTVLEQRHVLSEGDSYRLTSVLRLMRDLADKLQPSD